MRSRPWKSKTKSNFVFRISWVSARKPLAPPPPQRIPGRLRSQGPLRNPDALLEPMPAAELASWDDASRLPELPQP